MLSGATNASIAGGLATAAVADNDATPLFSITDAFVAEGNTPNNFATFTVTLSSPSGRETSITATAIGDTATIGSDFTSATAELLFQPGETSKTFTVPVRGDTLNESDEQFLVQLSNARNATVADSTGIGTIFDNDPLPTVNVSDVLIAEGAGGTAVALFTVTLSAVSAREVTVRFATDDATALAGVDYVGVTDGLLTIPAGSSSGTIGITVNGDRMFEKSEHFLLTLSEPTAAVIGTVLARGTIINDDVNLINRRTAVFTDENGDLVTVSLDRGSFSEDDFTLVPVSGTVGTRLELLDLTANASQRQGATLSIVAEQQPVLGGDGITNVGRINATGIDLAVLKVDGDLRELDAGDGVTSSPAIGTLRARSMGTTVEDTGMAAYESLLVGGAHKVRVSGDVEGVRFAGSKGSFGSVVIGGDFNSVGRINSGLFADGTIGSIAVTGDLAGSAAAPLTISAQGIKKPAAGAAPSLGKAKIGGSVDFAKIMAGYAIDGRATNADARIGTVHVTGDWKASDLVAGARTTNEFFGDDDDTLIPSGSGVAARIAGIIIKGDVLGTPTQTGDDFGFVAEAIGTMRVGGVRLALTDDLAFATAEDVHVRLVS
jgi:hypothetical protein